MTEPGTPWTAIVLMGVSGAGKSTIAQILSERLKWPLLEADSFHPPANIEKMSKGTPLTDDDRWPWLRAIAARMDEARRANEQVIVTCSALKRAYREVLAARHDDVRFIYLKGAKELIGERLASRTGHFMPPRLLDSQFAALEEPEADEPCTVISIATAPGDIADAIMAEILATVRV